MEDSLRILYVDDEPDLLEIGKLFLERSGNVSVTTTGSATDALKLLETTQFDVIISDYQMPGIDGIQFLDEVRARFGKIPFIIFTGRGREEIVIQALNAGADFYLQKGGSPEAQFVELDHKVQIAVENFRSREKIQSLNRLYSVLSSTNKAIVFLKTKNEFFYEICRILVETGGFRMAWIGLASQDRKLIRPVAAAGHVNGYLDTVSISWEDVPSGRGPTGTAYREGTYNFSNDIARDPRMEPWRKEALSRGYMACAAFPFALGSKNAGVITLYAPVTGYFDARVIRLLEELSADISFALKALDDQDERKAAEEAQAESENRYRFLVDGLHDCVVVYQAIDDGRDFRIVEFNKSAEKTERVRRDEVIGHPVTEIFPGVAEFGILDVFRRVWRTGVSESFPVSFYTDNRISGWRDNFVYRLPSGEIVASYSDETARKQVEEALSKSEEQYRSLVETTDTGYVILDREGRVITANQEYLRLTGRSTLGEITGKPVTDWTAPYDLERNAREVQECFRTGRVRGLEIDYQHPDGTIQPIEINASVIQSGGQQIILTLCRDISDRKRAQDALRKSEEKFRNLFDWANDGILLHTLTTREEAGRFIDANPAACGMLGYSRDELLELGPPDIVPAEFHPLLDEIIGEAETKNSVRFETRLLRKDGTTLPVETSGHLVSYEGRKVWISHIRDISESLRLDEVLKKNEKFLQQITDNLTSGIVMIDAETHIIELVNPSAAALFGKKPDEIIGKRCHTFLCPSEEGACPITDLKKEIENAERFVMIPDGTMVPVLKSVRRLQIDQKEKLLENFIDVRDYRRAEDALRANERRLASIYETVSDVIFLLVVEPGGQYRFSSVNPAFCRVTGLPEDAVVGKTVDEVIPEPSRAMVLGRYRQAIVEKTIIRWEEISDYPAGRLIGEVSIAPVFDVSGNCTHLVGSVHNITAYKRAEEAIMQANRQLNLMTSITRHDIKNKITAIMGYLAIARKKFTDPALEEYFSGMESAVKAIRTQIEFTRVYHDLGTRQPQWENLDRILSTLHIPPTMTMNTDVSGIEVYADPMLEKVFSNLLDNSIRHGGHVTEISVTSCRSGDGIRIVWTDNGAGVGADEKERIFDRGYGKNTGFGLFLTREILSLTGISIRETGREGEGARFEIYVPPGKFHSNGHR